jgi:hypothetical protein
MSQNIRKQSIGHAPLTTAPAQIPIHAPAGSFRPEWCRLPKPGTLCPWTGLSRSKLWEVLQSGKVRNICLRKEGAQRGARLIHLASLLSHLDSMANEAESVGADDEAAEAVASAPSRSLKKGGRHE